MNPPATPLILSAIITLSLIGVTPSMGQIRADTKKPSFVPGEVIVKMKTPQDPQALSRSIFGAAQDVQTTSGGEFIIRLDRSRMMGLAEAEMQAGTLALVQELNQRNDVEYAQPNYIYYPSLVPDDPGYKDQWHYLKNGTGTGESPGGIGMPLSWEITKGTPEIAIAILDTGILSDHPDIQGSPNLIPGFDMISDPFMANDGDGRDSDPTDPGDAVRAFECGTGPPQDRQNSWHGTHVAGTVGVGITNNGQGIAGINWDSKVQAVRVLGKCGGTTADIIDGIRWAAGLPVPQVPNNPSPAKVINMSLGAPGVHCPTQDQATQSAIRDVVQAGTTVVVAAGNEAMDASQATPASCDNVIAVAASDVRGHLVTRYSNFGPMVDIMAPGGDVQRDDNNDTNPDGVLSFTKDSYKFANGTSMASPHVAGVAALILSQNPEFLPGQIEARLKHDALPRNNTQCPKPCGAGLLQAKFGEVTGKADLGVVVAVTPETVKVAESLTYTTTVTNHGPGEATKGNLVATLPQGVTVLSKEFNHGNCTGDSVFTCTVDPLLNGSHARLIVAVQADQAGPKTFRAEVKADEVDENTGNNLVSAVTQVTGRGPDPDPKTILKVMPLPTKGSLENFRDQDWYQFTLDTSQNIALETEGPTDVMMTLYGPNNQHTVLGQNLDGGQGVNAKIEVELAAGEYYVEIRHQSIFGSGPYEISVRQRN